MKIKSLAYENFEKFSKIKINLDEKLTYLVGPSGAGKSSAGLNGLWATMQSIAEKTSKGNCPLIGERFRFIGEKTAFAKNEAVLYDERTGHEVTVTRQMTKDATKINIFTASGAQLDQQWLNDIFNIFMIAPRVFMDLTSKEQAQALKIDTSTYDTKIANLKSELSDLNKELKNIIVPVIAPEKTEKVDVMEIQGKKVSEQERIKQEQDRINLKNKALTETWDLKVKNSNAEVDEFNDLQDQRSNLISTCQELLTSLQELGYTGEEVQTWINNLPQPEPKKEDEMGNPLYPVIPSPEYLPAADDSKIKEYDNQILLASSTNEKALTYSTYLKNLSDKSKKEIEIDNKKTAIKDEENNRLEYLKSCKLPFDNLTIDEEGRLMLDGRPIKEPYFSTGELLKIVPILISSTIKEDPDAPEFHTPLKYVYLQYFNLMDEDKQKDVIDYLIDKGFQLVVEYVGKNELPDKNCIVLSEMQIVNKKDPEPEQPKQENRLF